MDITAISNAMSSINVSSDVGMAVLGKNLDTLEQTGEGLKKMMESSVTPNLGQNIDYLA